MKVEYAVKVNDNSTVYIHAYSATVAVEAVLSEVKAVIVSSEQTGHSSQEFKAVDFLGKEYTVKAWVYSL